MGTARLEDLATIESVAWDELCLAPLQRDHPWRVAVLATTDGTRAEARSVVLREVHRASREILFFCDARSPKAAQIEAYPQGTLVVWSQVMSWQLRLQVHLTVHTTGLAVSSRWARAKMKPGAQDYLTPLPPGTPVEVPTPERGTRDHFAVVSATVVAMDWLELSAEGHRRAAFDDQGRRWLTP